MMLVHFTTIVSVVKKTFILTIKQQSQPVVTAASQPGYCTLLPGFYTFLSRNVGISEIYTNVNSVIVDAPGRA